MIALGSIGSSAPRGTRLRKSPIKSVAVSSFWREAGLLIGNACKTGLSVTCPSNSGLLRRKFPPRVVVPKPFAFGPPRTRVVSSPKWMGYRTVSRQLFGTLPDSGMPARLYPELTENQTSQAVHRTSRIPMCNHPNRILPPECSEPPMLDIDSVLAFKSASEEKWRNTSIKGTGLGLSNPRRRLAGILC